MVSDNHDKAHEEMSLDDAVSRGQEIAQENHEVEQKHIEESKEDTGKGQKPTEGNVPENNADNGFGNLDKTTATDKAGNRRTRRK